jgi:hypothetical protein
MPGPKPIIVNSKNDPRYRAYLDSLNSFNLAPLYTKEIQAVFKQNNSLQQHHDKINNVVEKYNKLRYNPRLGYNKKYIGQKIIDNHGLSASNFDFKEPIQPVYFNVPISGPQEFEPTIEQPQQIQEQIVPREKTTIPIQEGAYFTREQQGQELGGTRYVDKKTGKLIGQMNNGAFEYSPLWLEMNPELQSKSQFAEGGQMKTPNLLEGLVKKIMTSNTDGTNIMPNAEIEDKEMVKTPDGQVYEAEGEKHEDGGIKVNLEDKTRILTDRGTPNAQNRKLVSEIFDINVKGKDSFSDVLRKIEKKIGINTLEEEQLEIAEKVKKNLDTEDKNTRDLNDEFYSSKLNEAEAQREKLEQTKSEAYDLLYSMQESQKGVNDTYYDKETNIYVKRAQGGEILFPKSEQAKVLKYAQDNGITNPQDLVSHFQNKFASGGMMNSVLPKFVEGGPYEKELERLRKENNAIGSNNAGTKVGNKNWETMFYQPLYAAQTALGLPEQKFANHAQYQKYATTYFPKQVTGLTRSGDIELNNKQRQMLSKAKVKGANQKIKFSDLGPDDLKLLKKEYGSEDNFILEGYVDGIAGKRGINFLPGEATNEEYEKMEDPLKGTSYNNKNIPIYLQYGQDKRIKRENNIPTIYYPKPVAQVAEPTVIPKEKVAETATGRTVDNTVRKYKPLGQPYIPMPKQFDMYPSELRLPSLIVPPMREMSYMKVSPEQALQENARQYGAIQDRVAGTPDGTQGLVLSDVAGKLFNANTQAVGQANQQNIGIRTNFDQMDTAARSNWDMNRANALANYERLAQTAVGNTENSWRRYYNARNAKDILAFKDMQTMRMAEAMTPDVNYNLYRGDYDYNAPDIYLGNTIPDKDKAAKELAMARQLEESRKKQAKK